MGLPITSFDKIFKTKFSVAFTSVLGQLLPCSHVYNQYIFIDDASKTIKQLESKRLRLQSLSAYSRENAIARDAVNDFLNEAIGEQRQPVKAHFNVLVWTKDKEKLKDLRNMVASALAQMDLGWQLTIELLVSYMNTDTLNINPLTVIVLEV